MILAICDDDKSYTEYLASLCRPLPFIETLFLYGDAEHLLSDVRSGSRIDAVLMDIELGSTQTGIDYMTELYSLNPRIRVVYVTGYVERFVQHVFLKPSLLMGFITKPVAPDILLAVLKKYKKLWIQTSSRFCFFPKSRRMQFPVTACSIWKAMRILSTSIRNPVPFLSMGSFPTLPGSFPLPFFNATKAIS